MAATPYHTLQDAACEDVPFTVQDRRRKGFFTIDNELLDRYGMVLGPHGLTVYMALARFANPNGECFPSQGTIAQRTGMSRMQVNREINKLRVLCLIEVEHRFGRKGEKRANLYILLDLPDVTVGDTPCHCLLQPHVTDSDIPCNGELQQNNIKQNKTQKKQQDPIQHRRQRRNREPKPVVPDENHDVVVVLIDLGVAEKVACQLTQHYSRARVLEKIAYLEFLRTEDPDKIQNPRGWLRRAIEEDYAAPDGYLPKEERDQQAATAVQKAQEAQALADSALAEAQAYRVQQKAAQAAARQALNDQYGTTADDVAFWQQAQLELRFTMPGERSDWLRHAHILKVQHDVALIGVEYESEWRQLQHPGTQTAVGRALSHVAGRPVAVAAVLLQDTR